MQIISNSVITNQLLKVLVEKISRRTSDSFALVTIDTILKILEKKFDFLKYIQINRELYSEGIDAISIDKNIDEIQPGDYFKAIHEFIKITVKYLKRNADYFFIREFQEAIENIPGLNLNETGLDLSYMQFQYIVDSKQARQFEFNLLIEKVLSSLAMVVNCIYPEKDTILILKNSVEKLKQKNSIFNYITIGGVQDSEGFYEINVSEKINSLISVSISKAIQDLIQEISSKIEWTLEESFIDRFKKEIGENNMMKLKDLGVNFQEIKFSIIQKENQQLMEKTIDTLIKILGQKTSENYAYISVINIINSIKDDYNVLKFIEVDDSKINLGLNSLNIKSEINLVDPYKVATALREIIKITGSYLGDHKKAFIEEFKKQLGEEYISELSRIGVNLHFLELKFSS